MLIRFLRRLGYRLTRDRHAADLAEEMDFHRALSGDRAMGNITLAREEAWDVWSFGWLERVWRDAVYGVRGLRREPVFASTAFLTLTLGITAMTTVFSVVDAELWRPLPFPDADRLVAARAVTVGSNVEYKPIAAADFLDWRAGSRLAEYAAEQNFSRRLLRHDGVSESVYALPVTANFFDVLARPPRMGRGFAAGDEHGARTVILSDGGWRRLFDRDPAVLERSVAMDGIDYTIVGVTADQHLEYDHVEPDLFVPIDFSGPSSQDRTARLLYVVGRLGPDVEPGQAQAELQTIGARIAGIYPADHTGYRIELQDLRLFDTGYNWRPLFFFLGAAGVVLLLSCLNAANLLLARALRRQREFAIRGALGGGRSALVRQLVVEAALLAAPSGAAGIVLAFWALKVFGAQIPEGYLERGGHFALDPRIAVFALLISGGTTLLLSLAPLTSARRIDLNLMLGQGARTAGASVRQVRARNTLLVGQLTMTLVLMVAAGLFVASYARLTGAPLGFEPRDRAAAHVSLVGPRYAAAGTLRDVARRLLDHARALPGVSEAALGSSLPLGSGNVVQLVASKRPRAAEDGGASAIVRAIDANYFHALGIRLATGRSFGSGDIGGAPRVAVLNEYLAGVLFPGENAVGQSIDLVGARTPWTNHPGSLLVVGVASNIKDVGINEVEFGNLYVPFEQMPAPGIDVVVRTSVPAAAVAEALRRMAADVDPNLPLSKMTTMTQSVDQALQEDRFNALLIAGFAMVAILLAAVGIYGAMACAVQERTREFGVRLALGQQPGALVRATLWESARFGVLGGAAGLAIAVVGARILGNALYLVRGEHNGLLYGVRTTDPIALACAALALVVIATLSGIVPARQATRVDPLVALRAE
jgi:putative ABC transport system permease protein